ncbi:MAG: S1/P1 nuclease [Alistipes sp.]|nr:S1/P1 nuclease [Alistipes sp.]
MKRLTLVVVLFALSTHIAVAWNNIGHATIALIAERNMTEEAKQGCRSYLKHNLPYYASWMDYWRNCAGFEQTSYWHGVPVDEHNEQIKDDTRNAAYQIKRICKRMRKYHRLKDSIVCDNLKYLIHMVGDMHCPVHTKYNNEPALKQRSVRMKGNKLGFHTFWDASIGYYNPKMKCDQIAEKYDTLTDEQIAEICKGTPDDWAKQNAIEMREIYTLMAMQSEVTEVDSARHERMKQIAMKQMLRGGYRLAKVMNDIFREVL